MPKRAKCAGCDRTISITAKSLPAGQAKCRDCRFGRTPKPCVECSRNVDGGDGNLCLRCTRQGVVNRCQCGKEISPLANQCRLCNWNVTSEAEIHRLTEVSAGHGTCSICGRVRVYGRGRFICSTYAKAKSARYVRNKEDSRQTFLITQHFQCGICHVPLGAGSEARSVVDHDHDTGMIRGVLCVACNCAIGFLRDSAVLAESAARYLRKPPLTPLAAPFADYEKGTLPPRS